ncbi:TadE/TadG family type IV pilus assembly protein [Sinorhizobium fredii]|uniref:TadE/TadG family type IV pilus assembly protein n=1 Tax=Rhizobium fredii TaxID=380 RepID=UPI003514F1E0
MVASRFFKPFRQDESGVALTEALITFPIVLLMFAAFIEFGYAMSQWNLTVKALQMGARLAAVSDPLINDFDEFFPTEADDPLDNGDATPNDATISFTCGPFRENCNDAALNRIVYGSTSETSCKPRGTPGIRFALCHVNPRIEADNIAVTYQRSGLGYWGRPEGPVLTMRMEVRNMQTPTLLLGGLLGIDKITLPAHPVTITTEDLQTCSTC